MEPTKLIAGDSIAWAREAPAYSFDGWGLLYVLRGPGQLDVTASGGPVFEFTISAAESATLPAGIYNWACYATKGPDRKTLARGEVEVLADLAQAAEIDPRGHARRMLALIEAALEKRIPKDQQSYEIDGMRLDRIPIERLNALRLQYRREAAAKRGKPFGRRILARL